MPRDLEALRRALRTHLPGGEKISAIRPLAHGFSNATYVLEGTGSILRMPPENESLLPPYDMARQYDIYRRVGAVLGGPPVPRVSHLCEDLAIAGVPFYLMERLPGETFDRHTMPAWLTSDPSAFDAFCRAWVDLFVAVHRMPPDTLAGPRRTSASEAEAWLATARREQAPPLIIDVLAALAADPPADTGPPAPVHGDPNLTNVLWDGPRVTGLLDWELSGIGEPFSDIAFLLAFFRDEGEPESWGIDGPGCWSKPRIVSHWEERMGRTVRSWRRHELLAMARLATILRIGDNLAASQARAEDRLSNLAARLPSYLDRLERRWSKRLLDA